MPPINSKRRAKHRRPQGKACKHLDRTIERYHPKTEGWKKEWIDALTMFLKMREPEIDFLTEVGRAIQDRRRVILKRRAERIKRYAITCPNRYNSLPHSLVAAVDESGIPIVGVVICQWCQKTLLRESREAKIILDEI